MTLLVYLTYVQLAPSERHLEDNILTGEAGHTGSAFTLSADTVQNVLSVYAPWDVLLGYLQEVSPPEITDNVAFTVPDYYFQQPSRSRQRLHEITPKDRTEKQNVKSRTASLSMMQIFYMLFLVADAHSFNETCYGFAA